MSASVWSGFSLAPAAVTIRMMPRHVDDSLHLAMM